MAELTAQADLPRPEIEESAGCVVVRFRPSRYLPPSQVKQDLSKRQQAILEFLSYQERGVSRAAIVEGLREAKLAIREDLEKLRTFGLVTTEGHGRGAVWKLVRD